MKKISLFVGILLYGNISFSQNFDLLSTSENATSIRHSLANTSQQNVNINGLSYVDYAKSHKITTKEAGAPQIPMFSESVIVPNKGAVSIIIESDGYIEYTNVLVAPSKGSLKRNVNPSEVPYTFGEAYNQDQFYPGNLAVAHDPFVLRNTRGITVTFYPYQYNPVTKTLRVYQNIKASVQTNPTAEGLNEIEETTAVPLDDFDDIYKHTFINSPVLQTRYTPKPETGEMLVIAPPTYTSQIQTLVDWKNQKGIKTTVATTTQTGTTNAAIKAYIQSFYASNPNLIFVLLIGDHAQVASYTYGVNGQGDQLYSDTYYAQLAGGASDLHPDVFIGRFSGTTAEVTTMVNRVLEYEKNPAAGNWMTKAIGIGSDQGAGYGDEGEADWQHERNIRTKLMTFGYTTVAELYDGNQSGADASGNPTAANIVTALSAGAGLINYTGHGDNDLLVTANFTTTNMNTATNNGMYPFVVSVACNNGKFTSGNCISESWLKSSNTTGPKGAIASVGSSILMAWAEPMQTQDEMVDILTNQYSNNKKTTIGGLFYNAQLSMLEEYNNTNAQEVMKTWILFGDPSTLFRNQLTQTITASHVSSTPQSTTTLTVTCNVNGALVCITQDNVILGTAIVSGGQAVITLTSIPNTNDLLVTATSQNYSIYQGDIAISTGGPASAAIASSDTDNTICSGTNVTFTATPQNFGTPVYQWAVNGSTVGTNSSTYTTNALTNGQTVTCTVTENSTVVNTNTVTMTVNASPATPTLTTNSPLCSGNPLNLTTPTVSNATYAWSGPNGYTSPSQNPTVSSAATTNTGNYTVAVTVNGCTTTSSTSAVTVNQTVTPAISISGTTMACQGQSLTLTGSGTGGGTNPAYQWTVNGNNVGNSSTYASTSFNNGDVVTCTLTSNATCATTSTATSAPVTMTINLIPATPSISVSGTTLTSSSATGNQWYMNGSAISGAISQTYVATQNNNYTVKVTNGNCVSSASAASSVTTVGINEIIEEGTSFTVFPNPSNGKFTVSLTSEKITNYSIELRNVIGQIIFSEEIKEFSGSYSKDFDVSTYGKGQYFLTLKNAETLQIEKVIVH